MIVMVSNQNRMEFGWMAGKWPGRVGHLYGPGGKRGPYNFMPYALDNGAYSAWEANTEFPEEPWRRLLHWGAEQLQQPLWAAVPDKVADRDRTLELWERYSPIVTAAGLRPAFVAQDGMTTDDVPDDDCMVFIGGTDLFKIPAIVPWCAAFPGRVHVGRVNKPDRLNRCYRAGAVSVDGTGWWHHQQRKELQQFLEATA